ncbi:hypothetical protein ACFVH9_23595 [Streptomyces hirsutus]|uniref:hypothetical protein n=1 Tax=Streptomyces hirsutus TaxID=35620 RepID=UPI0036303DEE
MSDAWDAFLDALSDIGVPHPVDALSALAGSGVDLEALTPAQVAEIISELNGNAQPGGAGHDIRFGQGGYHGTYNGIPNCWFSSDGKVYAPDGTCVGAA